MFLLGQLQTSGSKASSAFSFNLTSLAKGLWGSFRKSLGIETMSLVFPSIFQTLIIAGAKCSSVQLAVVSTGKSLKAPFNLCLLDTSEASELEVSCMV